MDERLEPKEYIVKQLYQNILNDEVSNVHTQLLDDKDMARRVAAHCKKAARFDLEKNY